jgi:hypothetical protein
MGSFIGSQADNAICDVLITRFSNQTNPHDAQHRTYIRQLRDHFNNSENIFDGNHHLHRVFHRLAISVTGGARVPSDSKSRHRWLHLLHGNLPANTEAAIRAVLSAVLASNSTVDYVIFSTRHVPTVSGSFELFPQNSGIPDTHTDANGKNYCNVILECNADVPLPDAPNEQDPPASDGNEKPVSAGAAKKKKAPTKKSSAKKKAGKKAKKK